MEKTGYMKKIEIIQKLEVLKELKSKKEIVGRLANYNTGSIKHLKQLAFHMCNKKNRWVFGGNRSGKTECGAVETVWLARGIHPYRQNKDNVSIWVVSLSTQVQRDVAQSKVLSYISPHWIKEIVMLSGRKDSPSSSNEGISFRFCRLYG